MDLTRAQRIGLFVVVVALFAALGLLLTWHRAASAGHVATGGHQATVPPPATVPASRPPTPPPAATGAAAGPVDIYRWLPFSQAGLTAAAGTVRAFCASYLTYTPAENATTYVGHMSGLVTPQLAATLARGFGTLGVAASRRAERQSASGHGQITALRAFGPASLTFLVTLTQRIAGAHGSSQQSTGYAVTVTGAGTRWRVNDIELASAGNS